MLDQSKVKTTILLVIVLININSNSFFVVQSTLSFTIRFIYEISKLYATPS